MRNWAELLPDILYLICDCMASLKDTVVFGGVCSNWRCVAIERNLSLPLLPFPWLMLAENKNDELREFYSITEDKIYRYDLPELKGKKCMETKGWIVTVSDEGEMALVHPLSRVLIPLPHHKTSKCFKENFTNPFSFVRRVVLSSPPDPNNEKDCVLAILHGEFASVGFCRLGDKVWTVVDNSRAIESLEYYRGKFYVATWNGEIEEFDIDGNSNTILLISQRKINLNFFKYLSCNQPYLVNSGGSLLVVIRGGVHGSNYCDTDFWVLKIDIEQEIYRRVKNLGTRAIFIGHSASLSIDTNWYPQLKANSIYFTDDSIEHYSLIPEREPESDSEPDSEPNSEPDVENLPEGGGRNMGVYNMEDKSIQPHYNGKSLSFFCPPVWTFLTIK